MDLKSCKLLIIPCPNKKNPSLPSYHLFLNMRSYQIMSDFLITHSTWLVARLSEGKHYVPQDTIIAFVDILQ